MLNFDDYDYLRFCRARDFKLKDVKIMLGNYVQWRRDNNIDDVIANRNWPEMDEVKKHLRVGNHKTDKEGRPVYIDLIGHCDLNELFKITTPENII